MMQISKRDFLKYLGLGGVGLAGGAFADDPRSFSYKGPIPEGAIGNPASPAFCRNIFPLPHTIEDGPSCEERDGKVYQPAREIPVFHKTDVVVVGGGPAGFAAAVAAARTGAKVALIERYGSLGGLFTNGMVLVMLATSRKRDGKFQIVTKGVCEEFMNRAVAMGPKVASKTPRAKDNGNWQPTVDPEAAKVLMDRMIKEAGVEMFFHSWGVDVIQAGNVVKGVVFESKQGRQAILAKQVVDCSGDGDVYFQAGANYRQITHAIGFVTRLANMDRITAKKRPVDENGKPIPGSFPLHGNEANPSTMWTGLGGVGIKGNGLDVRELSAAEVWHREQAWSKVEKMQKTPGWEEVFIANTCSQIGPRTTRLLDAELIVDLELLKTKPKFDDVVGLFGGRIDLPYRQLLPKGVENLLAAGRCIGAPNTTDTFRLICPCFVSGQAAGTAAALAALKGCTPRTLPIADLQAQLRKDNVALA